MTLDTIRDRLPDYARDLKLNLGSVLTPQGAPGLSERQIAALALATAIAARNPQLVRAIESWAEPQLDAAHAQAARAAAAIMGMNNIYYRFTHLVSAPDYKTMPAKLRMNVIARPGVEKVDFELWSLAVSAINGCGMCVDAHEHEVRKAGLSAEAIQAAVRIAAVVHAVAATLDGEDALAASPVASAA